MKTQAEIEAKLVQLRADQSGDYVDPAELLEWALAPSPVVHEGAEKERCNHTHEGWFNKEKVFAEAWKKANDPPGFLNGGNGVLLLLLCTMPANAPWGPGYRISRHLTQEEATAAASAIQWLGTNCGWCWLEETIRDCGFDIVPHMSADLRESAEKLAEACTAACSENTDAYMEYLALRINAVCEALGDSDRVRYVVHGDCGRFVLVKAEVK